MTQRSIGVERRGKKTRLKSEFQLDDGGSLRRGNDLLIMDGHLKTSSFFKNKLIPPTSQTINGLSANSIAAKVNGLTITNDAPESTAC